ncbi:hypothetical protein AB0L63_04685 [Nocardia sp. NPDC051990]
MKPAVRFGQMVTEPLVDDVRMLWRGPRIVGGVLLGAEQCES